MRKIDRNASYGGYETQALFYEFERVAVQNGIHDEFPDEYAFYFLAASAVLLRSIDKFSEDLDLFTVRERSDRVTKIDIWRLNDSLYFEKLWDGKLWEYLGYDHPFYQDYYFEIPFEGTRGLVHRMGDIDDWIDSSTFVSEFGLETRGLVNNKKWGCENNPYDQLTWQMHMCRFLGNTIFLCKEVLRECPDYAAPIRRVMFAFNKDREKEAELVYESAMAATRLRLH